MKHASLRKPKHKELVVATSKGWEVERTGELLVRFRGLDQKLKETVIIEGEEYTVVDLSNSSAVDLPTSLNLDTELNNLINTISMVAGEKLKLVLEAAEAEAKDETEQSSDDENSDERKDENEQSSGDEKGEEPEGAKEVTEEQAPQAAPKKRGRPAKPKPTV